MNCMSLEMLPMFHVLICSQTLSTPATSSRQLRSCGGLAPAIHHLPYQLPETEVSMRLLPRVTAEPAIHMVVLNITMAFPQPPWNTARSACHHSRRMCKYTDTDRVRSAAVHELTRASRGCNTPASPHTAIPRFTYFSKAR